MIVTDAWYPQINGVVRTLTRTSEMLRCMGHQVEMITPKSFNTFPCPTYPEIRLSVFPSRKVSALIRSFAPDALHIATEGPLGLAARSHAKRNQLCFTTAYHTRFPEYVRARAIVPLAWTYAFLRWFHGPSRAVMAPTDRVLENLKIWGIKNVVWWPRGVDLDIFHPKNISQFATKNESIKRIAAAKKPVFLYVGRVSVEKNLEAFLKLELLGEKHVVGDGPALKGLTVKYPDVVFHGAKKIEELPEFYNRSDVFVFPSQTDTFGLVLLEAMACGIPVAAYPVTGPVDVIGNSGAGVLNSDLKKACVEALDIDRKLVRSYAEKFSWGAATKIFESHLVRICSADNGYNISTNPHKDNEGITRIVAATRNSLSGISFAIREEAAFRQEVLLASVLIPLALFLPASIAETFLMLGSTMFVLVAELLNSGVEAAIDRISLEHHRLSKRAKDYGSAAVMIAIIFCAITHAFFLWRWLSG